MALANKLQPAPEQPLPAQLLVQLQDSNAFIAWLQSVDPELNDDNLAALKSARLCSNAVFNVCQTEELLVTKLSKYIPEGSAMLIAAAYFKLRSASSPALAQPSAESSPLPPATSNAHLLELVQELVDAHREKKQRKSAVAMSDVRDDVWLELQAALGLEVKTVGCNLSVTGSVTAFKWDERDEDKRSDYSDWWQALLDPKKVRVAVMNGNAGNYSLTIPLLEGIPFRLSGTTDVAVVDSHSAITTTPVVGTLFVIEIKKPAVFKKETLHWTRQLQAELLAADYHSQHAPVGLLTDLASEWHFFWFEKDANTKKLCTTVVASAALAVALMRATILLLDPAIASSSRAKSPARGDSTPAPELRLEVGGRSKSPRRATSEIPEAPWHRRTHVVPRTKVLAP